MQMTHLSGLVAECSEALNAEGRWLDPLAGQVKAWKIDLRWFPG